MNQGDSMSDKFQLLLEQIGMPLELRESGAFSAGKIEKVLVHKVSKVWEFTFRLPQVLDISQYQLFNHLLRICRGTNRRNYFCFSHQLFPYILDFYHNVKYIIPNSPA